MAGPVLYGLNIYAAGYELCYVMMAQVMESVTYANAFANIPPNFSQYIGVQNPSSLGSKNKILVFVRGSQSQPVFQLCNLINYS
jgi:hypothetical protein